MRCSMSVSRCILIVEDEPLISMMLEDFVQSLGHSVAAICESVDEALKAIDGDPFDLAILDVNLKGENVWPVARALRERAVPFVLASGGHVDPPPQEFAGVPMIDKPFTLDRIKPVIEGASAVAPQKE